jgi:hypothetical protein
MGDVSATSSPTTTQSFSQFLMHDVAPRAGYPRRGDGRHSRQSQCEDRLPHIEHDTEHSFLIRCNTRQNIREFAAFISNSSDEHILVFFYYSTSFDLE